MMVNRCLVVALVVTFSAACGAPARFPAPESVADNVTGAAITANEEAVKAAVDRFLQAIGNYDLEALPPMFTANANIGVASFHDGQWSAVTYTFEEFHAMLKSRENPSKYQEPVSHFTVHVDRGALAFVRADATLIRDGRPRSRNIDYFTLLKDDGTWKYLSASYVATAITQ